MPVLFWPCFLGLFFFGRGQLCLSFLGLFLGLLGLWAVADYACPFLGRRAAKNRGERIRTSDPLLPKQVR